MSMIRFYVKLFVTDPSSQKEKGVELSVVAGVLAELGTASRSMRRGWSF